MLTVNSHSKNKREKACFQLNVQSFVLPTYIGLTQRLMHEYKWTMEQMYNGTNVQFVSTMSKM